MTACGGPFTTRWVKAGCRKVTGFFYTLRECFIKLKYIPAGLPSVTDLTQNNRPPSFMWAKVSFSFKKRVMTMTFKSTPPKHLSREAKGIFNAISQEYEISDCAGLKILRVAAEAFDRAQAAREQIDKDGMTVVDKAGQTKPHPLLPIERDSRAAFLAGLKALNLDMEPIKAIGRPAGDGGNHANK